MAQNTQRIYRTLEEIRQRKDELLDQIQEDHRKVNKLWDEMFVKRSEASKGEFIASMISKGTTLIDLYLMYRKLRKNYGGLFPWKKKR